jgi:hypothetical protein
MNVMADTGECQLGAESKSSGNSSRAWLFAPPEEHENRQKQGQRRPFGADWGGKLHLEWCIQGQIWLE